jgi:hypothetical protein
MIAIILAVTAPVPLHASDSDGSSEFDGAFLTLYVVHDHEHLAFRSYQITPSTSDAFTKICTQGKQIWINDQHFPCLSSELVEGGPPVQVEISLDAEKSMFGNYYLVSVQPTSFAALRDLNEQECSALQESMDKTEKGSTMPHLLSASLKNAKAVDGRNRSFVFVPYGKDKDGNRLTHVLSVSNGQSTYIGELPGWPEKLVNIGHSDAPQVIVNLAGDALVFQSFSIWPKVEGKMFVGEGG